MVKGLVRSIHAALTEPPISVVVFTIISTAFVLASAVLGFPTHSRDSPAAIPELCDELLVNERSGLAEETAMTNGERSLMVRLFVDISASIKRREDVDRRVNAVLRQLRSGDTLRVWTFGGDVRPILIDGSDTFRVGRPLGDPMLRHIGEEIARSTPLAGLQDARRRSLDTDLLAVLGVIRDDLDPPHFDERSANSVAVVISDFVHDVAAEFTEEKSLSSRLADLALKLYRPQSGRVAPGFYRLALMVEVDSTRISEESRAAQQMIISASEAAPAVWVFRKEHSMAQEEWDQQFYLLRHTYHLSFLEVDAGHQCPERKAGQLCLLADSNLERLPEIPVDVEFEGGPVVEAKLSSATRAVLIEIPKGVADLSHVKVTIRPEFIADSKTLEMTLPVLPVTTSIVRFLPEAPAKPRLVIGTGVVSIHGSLVSNTHDGLCIFVPPTAEGLMMEPIWIPGARAIRGTSLNEHSRWVRLRLDVQYRIQGIPAYPEVKTVPLSLYYKKRGGEAAKVFIDEGSASMIVRRPDPRREPIFAAMMALGGARWPRAGSAITVTLVLVYIFVVRRDLLEPSADRWRLWVAYALGSMMALGIGYLFAFDYLLDLNGIDYRDGLSRFLEVWLLPQIVVLSFVELVKLVVAIRITSFPELASYLVGSNVPDWVVVGFVGAIQIAGGVVS